MSSTREERPGARVDAVNLALAMAVIVGLFLRAYQLGGQIVADDEWHALEAVMHRSYLGILSSFGVSDYCIPLTLFDKLLSRTVGLTEAWLRAPAFLAGSAALVVLPVLVRPLIGAGATVLFAWLLAICPMHVYFSRYARPYSLTFLLAFVAGIAMFQWQRSARRAWAITYVACGVFAVYLHLIVLPIVAAPILFELGAALGRARPIHAPRLRNVIIAGGALAIGAGGLIALPLIYDARSMTGKVATGSVRLGTLLGTFELFSGTGHRIVSVALALLAAVGIASLWRRDRRLVLYLAFGVLLQFGAVLAMRPAVLDSPIVLARYCLSTLPFFLMAAAVGVVVLVARLRGPWAVRLTAGAIVAVLFAFGPIPKTYGYRPNNFTNHPLFQYTYDASREYAFDRILHPPKIPEFYRILSRLKPGSTTVVEAPWYLNWGWNPYPYYQAIHRQEVVIGAFANNTAKTSRWGELILGSGIELEHEVHVGDAAGLHRRGVRYVIFHKNLRGELPKLSPPRLDPGSWIANYRKQYGAPAYEDESLVVFDIAPPAVASRP